VVVARSITC